MPENFFQRLHDYYLTVAEVMSGKSEVAAIFPNTTDKGMSREQVYIEFLRQHAPSKFNVFPGGFVFGVDGTESKQLDILVTTDTCPGYRFQEVKEGRSFSPVDGTIAVASIKSMLNKEGLLDSLDGMAAIPMNSLDVAKFNPQITNVIYDDWPYKIVYANNSISIKKILEHLSVYYSTYQEIPLGRRPNIIHVGGKFALIRVITGMDKESVPLCRMPGEIECEFAVVQTNPDLQAIVWVLDALHKQASLANHILFGYEFIINKVLETKNT